MVNKIQELFSMVQEINSYNGGLDHLDVYDMDCFNELMEHFDPIDLAMRIFFGEFNPNHEYFKFNGYGNLESLSEYDLEKELLDWEEDIRESYKEIFE